MDGPTPGQSIVGVTRATVRPASLSDHRTRKPEAPAAGSRPSSARADSAKFDRRARRFGSRPRAAAAAPARRPPGWAQPGSAAAGPGGGPGSSLGPQGRRRQREGHGGSVGGTVRRVPGSAAGPDRRPPASSAPPGRRRPAGEPEPALPVRVSAVRPRPGRARAGDAELEAAPRAPTFWRLPSPPARTGKRPGSDSAVIR